MSAPLACSLHLLDHSHRATTFLTLARPFVLHSLRPLRHSSCHPSTSPLRRIPPPGRTLPSPHIKTQNSSTRSHPRRDLPSVHTVRSRLVLVFSFLDTLCTVFVHA